MARFEMRDTRYETGSALILAVVLTSLLAIIGVMFLMVARVDRTATSGISENKELDSAVETVVAKISQVLVSDVPRLGGAEYYDYPGEEDKWLASLEPYEKTAGNYYWRQISDVYNKNFPIPSQGLQVVIVPDYQVSSQIGDSNNSSYYRADADGDGVADSVWVRIPEMTSNKGKPIYTAIRVVDNGGMLNVNTAYKFDPNEPMGRIDGSSQMQINLAALSQRGKNGTLDNAADDLQDERCGSEPNDLSLYEENVVWRYNEPDGGYTPFDLSDELEMRNRFTLNRNDIDTRVEEVWDAAFQDHYLSTPVTGSLSDWREEVYYDWLDPNANYNYSYRHIGTIYNMDRIIRPNGEKMLNVNKAEKWPLYAAIRTALSTDPNFADVNDVAAQIAVNLIDFRDNDSNVTTFIGDKTYYGFERPCVYISELAHRFRKLTLLPTAPIRFTIRNSYAIELYKTYKEDAYPEPNQWRLSIEGYGTFPVNWKGTRHFHVLLFEDPCAPLTVSFDPGDIDDTNFPSPAPDLITIDFNTPAIFASGKTVSLERLTDAGWISVDSIVVPGWLVPIPPVEETRSFKRDIMLHKCIRRLWDLSGSMMDSQSLGQGSPYFNSGNPDMIQAHPEDKPFTNVGEIGMLFRKSAYSQGPNPIGPVDIEATARINLADLNFQQLFKYLTVFDPTEDKIDNDGDGLTDEYGVPPVAGDELKIPGRININTAPWFVLAQLPWVTNMTLAPDDPDRYKLAQAIVKYRDEEKAPKGFENIGELMNVTGIDYYATDTAPSGFPDLTPNDDVGDDFEERDVIFARISNLVTVRSDVFTAYILVRIGTNGPQKRAIALLDRSGVYPPDDGKVRVIALHSVPDPR